MSEAPESVANVWVVDLDWQCLAPGERKKCRRARCPNDAVARFWRPARRPGGGSWWCYCAAHLYGRRVEDGRVLVNVHPDSPAARAGRFSLNRSRPGAAP